MNETVLGPDGFPFAKSDRLSSEHLLLDEYLCEPVHDFERFVPDPKWKKLAKRQTITPLGVACL